ncbi:hypothetical protein [Saccharothrix syringae]|uniref:Uncharacterized protein n=1 Tax=Saccharothrix syringae TaxID=103733 RepID=A0A5Q0H353_SACSY|nr:hypothetical protein [Saccharothrix syringae]QFZ20345.1 hypothetical protein EKG83_25615 [Saccharothrix syringae]
MLDVVVVPLGRFDGVSVPRSPVPPSRPVPVSGLPGRSPPEVFPSGELPSGLLPGEPSRPLLPRCRNPPCLMLLGESTSRPVALPASLPTTFMIFSKTSTKRLSSGETFLIVSNRSWTIFAIFAAHFEIAVTACATITGVPNPRLNTASNTQAISLPTRSAIRSRTTSRTNPTTMPIIPTTVPTVPAADAAPDNASECCLELARYASAAGPVQPCVPDFTASAYSWATFPSSSETLPHVVEYDSITGGSPASLSSMSLSGCTCSIRNAAAEDSSVPNGSMAIAAASAARPTMPRPAWIQLPSLMPL